METLNEVIKIFEAYSHCRYDLYEGPAQSTVTNALHYLKEYQKILPLVPSLINTALLVQKKGKTIG